MKPQRTYNFIPYLLGISLTSTIILGCNSAAITEEESDTSITAAVTNLTIQPGSDESSLNFTWYSTDTTDAQLQIALASDMTGSDFPESYAMTYSGTAATPEVGETSDDDRPSGPPSSDDDTSTSDDGDDTATVTSYSETDTTEDDETESTSDGDTDSTSDDETEESSDEETSYVSNEVTVIDLEANTTYVYRVGDGSEYSEVYTFTTGDDSSYSFILVGDPQIGSSGSNDSDQEGWEETLTEAMTTFPGSSFILGVGDQINTSTDEDEYSAFFAAEELSSYPFVPAVGNHDNDILYQYHFNIPNESSEYGTTDASGDYYFTYGPALFMVLNSNNDSATSHEAFIEDAIANADSDIAWKIVVLHHSIYSSADHSADEYITDLRSGLYPVFDANEIDVVLMGHDHAYSRTYQMYGDEAQTDQTTDENGYVVDPTGTVYFTANSASGSKYYDLEDNDTTYRAVRWQGEETSYSNVEITDSTFVITTYTTADHEEIDTYAISKTN